MSQTTDTNIISSINAVEGFDPVPYQTIRKLRKVLTEEDHK